MTAEAELHELVDRWRPAARKGKLFKKRAKRDAGDLAGAQRLAALAQVTDAAGDDVIEALGVACKAFEDDRSIRLAYAQSLAGAGRVGEAIAEYEERLQSVPDDAGCLLDVASLYERANRADLAVDRLRRAVDTLIAGGEVDGAIVAARRLIALEPASLENASDLVALLRTRDADVLADGLEHLADVYRERAKLGQEAAACTELLSIRPERDDVAKRLASIYTRILEVDPDDPDAWIGLAAVDETLAGQLRVLLDSERVAVPSPEAATAAVPQRERHETYEIRKARELMAEGDVAGASLCLERAVRTHGDPGHRLELAQCYRTLHREDEAAHAALRALAEAQVARLEGTAEAALAWLADALPEAKEALENAVFLNHRPDSADILYEELVAVCDAAQKAARGAEMSEPRGA